MTTYADIVIERGHWAACLGNSAQIFNMTLIGALEFCDPISYKLIKKELKEAIACYPPEASAFYKLLKEKFDIEFKFLHDNNRPMLRPIFQPRDVIYLIQILTDNYETEICLSSVSLIIIDSKDDTRTTAPETANLSELGTRLSSKIPAVC